MAVKPIPDGYPVVTPYLAVDNARQVLEFIITALGGVVRGPIMDGPDGKIGHAEITIGDSLVMLGDVSLNDDPTPRPALIHLYVEDVDKTFALASESGATVVKEPVNQFYGDRTASVQDAGGTVWYLASHVEDVSPDEMERRMAEMA